jgi:RHS repeat-associated protein
MDPWPSINYTRKLFDFSSNLYYFNARWYDCELGRFTSQDPARDGVNWWIYCGNNPLKYVDPTGMYSEDEIKSFKKSSAEEQMTFLKNEYNSVQSENSTNADRGAKAAEM